MRESLAKQYSIVKSEVNLSHVSRYGNESFDAEPIGDFQAAGKWGGLGGLLGRTRSAAPPAEADPRRTSVDSRSASLHSLMYRYQRAVTSGAPTPAREALSAAIQSELASQAHFNAAFDRLATDVLGAASARAALAEPMPADFAAWECYRAGNEAVAASPCGPFTDYSLQFASLVARMCAHTGGDATAVADAVSLACRATAA
jgi:hypothetical protein